MELAGLLAYGLSAAAYVAITLMIVVAHPGSRQANWLLAAIVASFLWSASLLVLLWSRTGSDRIITIIDAGYLAVWVACLAAMMKVNPVAGAIGRLPVFLKGGAALLFGLVLALQVVVGGDASQQWASTAGFAGLLAISLLGLLAIEQIYRNAEYHERRVWMPMSLAVGAIFSIDVFVYSQAVLFGELVADVRVIRGAVSAIAAPAILLAIKRQPDWENKLFVSRQVVFYTTSLSAAGLYLIAMAIGGYFVGLSNLVWGPFVQILFMLCAALVLLYVIFSAELRRRLKVFIAKHFYRNRYDYREEWLRLIKTLAGAGAHPFPPARGAAALAAIIGSPHGDLWLRESNGQRFLAAPGWNSGGPLEDLEADDSIVEFMTRTRWVVDTQEYAEDPERYANAFAGDPRFADVPSIYVPLVHDDSLIGIVRLERPPGLGRLGYEDHDLLKTAGQQVAIFIAQERGKEELSQTRQLEAFSKLTTFLMHDLKNLIAQQELVVANAKKFGDRPEFVADAMRTIDASVQRMRKILGRLQGDVRGDRVGLIDLARLMGEACEACADRQPVPRVVSAGGGLTVAMNRERLAMAVTHAIRNAQDATEADGSIELRLSVDDGMAVIEVCDTGVGMDADFIHDRLFKPFDSTKGAQGMGIGAYQLRETLRGAGGDVSVRSEPGRGTSLRMTLPLAREAGARESVA